MPERTLPLAWCQATARQTASLLTDSGEGHLVTIAPTGAGKGISALIPALLSWPGPAIVIDPKAEAYHVTHRARRKLGQKVKVLDPFGVTGKSRDRLNPLDLIRADDVNSADDAAMIASLLAADMSKPADPFWDDRASTLIIGLILHFCQSLQDAAHLGQVRDELHVERSFKDAWALVFRNSDIPEVRAAAAVHETEPRVHSSIMATAQSHMSFIRSGPVQDTLKSSSIELLDIWRGKPLTLYIVLPPDKLRSHGRLLRLWVGVILTVLARRRAIPRVPTLMLIDEAAQLGKLEPLITAVTLLRGYGVKVWSFWQDLAQIRAIYGDEAFSLLNNCAIQQFFAPASPHAAAELDAYLAGSYPKPLTSLRDEDVLITRRGQRPSLCRRLDYRRDAMFAGRFDPNPFYKHRTAAADSPAPSPLPDNVHPFPDRNDLERGL